MIVDKCEECNRLTKGFSGESKWCCYCGAKLQGDTVELTADESIKWIPAARLAPVGCPLMLNLGAAYDFDIAHGERVDHLRSKDGEMTYLLSTGQIIVGKFDWTYP